MYNNFSSDEKLHYSDYEYKKYAHDEYGTYRTFRIGGAIIGVFIMAIIIMTFYSLFNSKSNSNSGDSGFVLVMIIGIIYSLTVHFISKAMVSKMDYLVSIGKERESETLRSNVDRVKKEIKDMSGFVKQVKSVGHVVMAGNGSTVIIDSQVTDSFNIMKQDDPSLAEALQTVSGFVENSNKEEAGQVWARFLKEISSNNDKIVMKSLWERLCSLLPDVAKMAESVAKITSVFS